MSSNDLELKFGADASGVVEGGEEATAAVDGVLQSVKGLVGALLELGGAATGSFREIRTGAAEAAESVKGAGEAVVAMREAISGVAELLLAAFAVEQIKSFVENLAQASEQAVHTAETFGLTVGQVQNMNAEAALFGVRGETLTTAMQRLDKAFAAAKEGGKQQTAAFTEMGISVNGAYTQTELMNAALEGLAQMDAGPAKVAAAMAVFGRNIKEIGPLLGLTSDQIDEANKKIEEYGAVNEVAASKGLALAEQMNEGKVAGMGFKATLTDALAPALTVMVEGLNGLVASFVQSYNAGGTAKTVMEGLDFTFKFLADTVGLFGTVIDYAFKTVDGAIWMFQAGATYAFGVAWAALRELWDGFVNFAVIAKDALTLNWGAIDGDMKAGAAKAAADVAAISQQMGSAAAQAFKKGADEWNSSDTDVANYEAWSKRLWSGAKGAAVPKAGAGTTADDPSKAPKDTSKDAFSGIVAEWQAQRDEQKAVDQNFWNDDLTGEEAFWRAKLAVVEAMSATSTAAEKAKTAAIREIRQKLYADEKTLANQERDDEIAQLAASVKANLDGENAKSQVVKDGIQARINAVQQEAKRGQINPQEELTQLVALNAQMVANERAKADAIYEINLQGLHDKEAIYATDPINLKKAQDQEVALAASHQQQLTQLEAKGVQDRQKLDQTSATQVEAIWRERISGSVQAFAQGMEGMALGTETLGQAVASVGQSILNVFVKIGERMLENWILSLAGVETQQGVTGVAQVQSNAAVAASAAFAATMAIPVIGPELAEGAALSAYGTAMAWAPLASAAGGWDIPAGLNPIVQAHEQEMILPASLANPLKKMLQAANGNFAGPAPANQPGAAPQAAPSPMHLHVHAMDAQSVQRLFDNSGEQLARTLEALVRDGRLRRPA